MLAFQSGRTKALEDAVAALQGELERFRADRELLRRELGTGDAARVVGGVRALRTEIEALRKAPPLPAEVDGEDGGGGGEAPGDVAARLSQFAAKIGSLNVTIGSMEEQLIALYQDREELEERLGASDPAGVFARLAECEAATPDAALAHIAELEAMVASMEKQLVTAYAGREKLEVGLGHSNPDEIVALFHNIRRMAGGIARELDGAVPGAAAAAA